MGRAVECLCFFVACFESVHVVFNISWLTEILNIEIWFLYFLPEGNIKTTLTLLVVSLLLAISSFCASLFCGALCLRM